MDIHFVSLHPIDLTASSSERTDVSNKDGAVMAYTQDLIATLLQQDTNRLFKFRSQTTEVRGRVDRIANASEYDKAPQAVADRLLKIEKNTQARYQQITKLMKGSLVQSCFTSDGRKYVVLTKIDHHAFLDEADLTKRIGMPYEKRVLKACLIPIETNGDFSQVRVYDTNQKIAEYWWKDFLELEEERSDEQNTETAFYAVEHFLAVEVKKKSKADYTYLRNDLVSYFRTRSDFRYQDLTDTLFGNYVPSVPALDADQIRTKAAQLPQKKHFDQQFSIESSVIKARYRNVIPLRENLELLLKAEVPNLDSVIRPFSEKGIKGIKITTESGWEHFNRKQAK